MLDKIDSFLLDFAAYDDEPLHIIIHAALSTGYFRSPEEVIQRLSNLIKKRYYTINIFQYVPVEKYITIPTLGKKDLIEYIEENKSTNFEEFPSQEYYLRTTREAHKLLDQDSLEI